MRPLLALLAAAALAAAQATSAPDTGGWVRGDRADPSARLGRVTVLLRHREGASERLAAAVEAVSEPSSPRYGRHLTAAQVAELVAPPQDVLDAAMAWLAPAGGVVSPTRDAVLLHAPRAADAERLFGVRVHEWTHPSRPRAVMLRASRAPAVPEALRGAVEFVAGVAGLARPQPRRALSADDPGITVSPPVVQQTYGVPKAPATATNCSVGMAEFEQAEFSNADVNQFQRQFGLAVANITVVGPNNGGYFGEASLDADVLATTANGVPTWSLAQDQFELASWGQLVLSTPGAPLVLSVSWGSGESSIYQLDRQNAELAKLASMGYSVLAASGDQGTGAQGGIFGGCNAFDPTFPATSPYVTAVGGTFLPALGSPEQGWSFSGGGFSAQFPQTPKWQQADVAKYLAAAGSALPPAKYWNSTGRVIPDVSALATNVNTVASGYLGTLSGTSAATPMFAGMIARINGERAAKGLAPLGFLNPWLYGAARAAFTDVTQGNNRNSACPAGFPAAAGYDAITGLGTPLYAKLLAAAL